MQAILALLAISAVGFPVPAHPDDEKEQSAAIHAHELRAHVRRLASREMQGRRGAGAARASRHLVAAFERLGLRPAFAGSYFQLIPAHPEQRTGTEQLGRNVAAILPGADPKLRDEWVLLAAHYDHLGVVKGVHYPGADDNASGIAMLLEVAEHFALGKGKPARTIVFVAFDQEEAGLLGSQHFVRRPPLPLRRLKAMLAADMLGRSMANVMDEYLFVLGSEHSRQLRRLVTTVRPPTGLKLGRLGADVVGTRSDYGPFRDRQVPFLFLSTGQHPDYHKPTDTPDRIDYAKLERISRWVAALTHRLADDEAPTWLKDALPPDPDEMRTVAELVRRVLRRTDLYPLPEDKRRVLVGVEKRLTTILDAERIRPEDRTWLVWTARLLLTTVF